MESGCVDNRELWDMIDQPASLLGLDKHVSGKEAMPCIFHDDPNGNLVGRVCPDKTILNKKIPGLSMGG